MEKGRRSEVSALGHIRQCLYLFIIIFVGCLMPHVHSKKQSGSVVQRDPHEISGYTYPLKYIADSTTSQESHFDHDTTITNTHPPSDQIVLSQSISPQPFTETVELTSSTVQSTPLLEDFVITTTVFEPSSTFQSMTVEPEFENKIMASSTFSVVYEATKVYEDLKNPTESPEVSSIETPSTTPVSSDSSETPRVAKHDNIPLGQCRDTRLPICKGVAPYKKTTLPNVVGDTTYISVNRSIPFFQLILKSHCNRRMLQLACSILEPKCANFRPLPPCRKFCRVATYGCAEYIPATLPISNVFSCERYPDSSDPNVCVNLAKNEECLSDEFKCPDNTCIPKDWQCDGVRDCVFAVDESNCSASEGNKACTTEEFQCDRKCIPARWRCDGEKDCEDGADESGCPKQAECGSNRFNCLDGSGCIPRRWVCDGKAECRDNSDEKDCSQKECAKEYYRCINGICIPKIWKCDGQDDCKDNSDEMNCNRTDPTYKKDEPPVS